MKKMILLTSMLLTTSLLAHPNGTYMIDGDSDVTVTFEYLNKCPDVSGSLGRGLRELTFSEAATDEPYLFSTGFFVEIHVDRQEVYVETNEDCVPIGEGQRIEAGRRHFGGFSLQRLQ